MSWRNFKSNTKEKTLKYYNKPWIINDIIGLLMNMHALMSVISEIQISSINSFTNILTSF